MPLGARILNTTLPMGESRIRRREGPRAARSIVGGAIPNHRMLKLDLSPHDVSVRSLPLGLAMMLVNIQLQVVVDVTDVCDELRLSEPGTSHASHDISICWTVMEPLPPSPVCWRTVSRINTRGIWQHFSKNFTVSSAAVGGDSCKVARKISAPTCDAVGS